MGLGEKEMEKINNFYASLNNGTTICLENKISKIPKKPFYFPT
jgi:hypothetical protein